MGCGCGKAKEKNTERQTTVAKIRNTVKKVWESAQPDQPTHIVKRINKNKNGSVNIKTFMYRRFKELVNNLTDRDVNIKNHLGCIKSVLEDKRIKNDATKIKKIKQILKNG